MGTVICPICGTVNHDVNPDSGYTLYCSQCQGVMNPPKRNRWDYGAPYEELTDEEKSELHERGRRYDEEQRQKQANEPPLPSYTPPLSLFTMPDSSMNQTTWDNEEDEYAQDEEDTDEEDDYIETPPAFVFTPSSPSSQAYTPAYQEQERHQPEQGKSRLGNDTQTGRYVDVPQASRRQGLYIIGIQGTGKSVLIENMIIQDIKQDRGVGLLDPHGDLTHTVLSRLPSEREKDVIYLDLTEYHYPFGINLFTCADPTNPAMVSEAASKVMHIFKKLWGKGGIVVEDAWGVLLEEILWNATYSFLEASNDTIYTMAEIPLLLTDSAFRNHVVNHITNRHVKNYWLKKYNPLSEKDQREETRSTLNRVNAFLTQPLVEYIVGQAQTTIDFRAIMDQGKILLFKLSKRHEAVTALIGSMVIAELLNAAYSRADLPVNKRKQFNLYADEFQNFATDDFATLLEEARKFGIGITIAHQNRGQLDTILKDRIRSVANLVMFKVNSKDAEELAGEFDITPQEAWEEETEEAWEQELRPESVEVKKPQEHRRIEEQITDYVEEDIREVPTNPVEYLLRTGTTHPSWKVREITRSMLIPFDEEIKSSLVTRERKQKVQENLSQLLADIMAVRVQIKTSLFAERIISVTRNYFSSKYKDMTWLGRGDDAFIRNLILDRDEVAVLSENFARQLVIQKAKEEGEAISETAISGGMWRETRNKEIGELVLFVTTLLDLCEELAKEPIRVPTGHKRMVPRTRTQVNWLTDESEKIQHPRIAITHPRKTISHPQRTYADVLNEVASQLVNLPVYTARVRITTEAGRAEHTIKTLDPKQQHNSFLFGQALQERLTRIKERNVQDGYVRERAAVEAEIIQRQEQPPEEEPPISRHPPR